MARKYPRTIQYTKGSKSFVVPYYEPEYLYDGIIHHERLGYDWVEVGL